MCVASDARATPTFGAVLRVDDVDLRGDLGNGALSLFEAIELASGRLDPKRLDDRERARIDGTPGARSWDTIRFAPGLVIRIPPLEGPIDSILPPLTDDGDAIEGTGATIDANALGGEPPRAPNDASIAGDDPALTAIPPLFVVRASHVSIAGLRIEALPATAIQISGERTSDVVVRDNVITGAGRHLPIDGIALTSRGMTARFEDLRIEGNRISDVAHGISLVAGEASRRDVRGSTLERASIVGNILSQVSSGISLVAASARLSESSGHRIRAVTIAGNQIVDAQDTGILVAAGVAGPGGTTRDNRIEELTLRGNWIWSSPGESRTAVGISLAAGFVGASSDGTSAQDVVHGLVIEKNAVDGPASGLRLFAGWCERSNAGASVRSAQIAGVEMRKNVWRNVDLGLTIAAAQASEADAVLKENAIERIELDGETILARDTALIASASSAQSKPRGAGVSRASLAENEISDLAMQGSWLEGQVGLVVAGGMTSGGSDSILDSAIDRLSLRDNTIEGGVEELIAAGGLVQSNGTVARSTIRDLDMQGNATARGDQPRLRIEAEILAAGASPQSAHENRVIGVAAR